MYVCACTRLEDSILPCPPTRHGHYSPKERKKDPGLFFVSTMLSCAEPSIAPLTMNARLPIDIYLCAVWLNTVFKSLHGFHLFSTALLLGSLGTRDYLLGGLKRTSIKITHGLSKNITPR